MDETSCESCGRISAAGEACTHCGARLETAELTEGTAIHAGSQIFPIADPSCLNAFFATVTLRLEEGRRGSRFPFSQYFWSGVLFAQHCEEARRELRAIHAELEKLPVSLLVWHWNDGRKPHPWTERVAAATSLGDYFVLSDGRRLLDVLDTAFRIAANEQRPVTLIDPK